MNKIHSTTVLVVVFAIGMVFVGGCVSRAEYDQSLAACRQANLELDKSRAATKGYQATNQQLSDQLSEIQQAVKIKDSRIGILQQQRKDLQTRFDKLEGLYRKMAGRSSKIPRLGPINILPTQVDKALRDFAKDNADLLEYLPKYGMIKLKADLTFEPGSDYTKSDAVKALGKFVQIINSGVASQFNIYIAGHTDNMRIGKASTKRRHPNNWYLSVHRAVSVGRVLTKAGLEPNRLGTLGFGEFHPIAPNKPNFGGNQANRRVEIWIVPPSRYLTEKSSQ